VQFIDISLEALAGIVRENVRNKAEERKVTFFGFKQRWAVIELHVIQLRNSITNYKCNL